MLTFGCLFLMGSYFCYDNPAPLKSTLEEPPFNFSEGQFNSLYSIYSLPNTVLPLLGGILLDKIGIRIGLVCFTIVLTIGQLIFTIGGYRESYPIMLTGRFVFGLGGECMTVAQSSIVTVWFKGKELAFAFGLNLSVARVGSFINGPVESIVSTNKSVGFALLIGFFICIFSLCTSIVLVCIDRWAEKKDNVKVELSDDEKFKWSDLKKFNTLPYWLVTVSCVIIYMVIFIYIGNGAEMLQNRFGFTKTQAGTYYATPYIISGIASPILGFTIDKVGKRTLFIASSSIMIFAACFITIFLDPRPQGDPNYLMMLPLSLLGLGYSVYAAAIWGCIPYTVDPKLIGSAFGLTTAIQNIGLTISPLIASVCLKTEKEDGYFWYLVYFCILSIIGFFINIWLYIDDIRNRGGILDKVDTGDKEEEEVPKVGDFVTSPTR